MINAINIALSGVQAASLRASNSANNIANAQSTSSIIDGNVVKQPFMPQDVVQISEPSGGVMAYTIPSGKPAVVLYDPVVGTEKMPNIDLAEELIKTQQAATDYKASLQVMRYAANMQSSLVDIFA